MDARQYQREVEYDLLDNTRIAPYKHTWKAHHNTTYWCILKLAQRKELQFYQTWSHAIAFFWTHYLRFVLRMWYTWRLERIYTAKYISPQGYRASFLRQIRNVDVSILLIPKRENPPTITANKASSTGKLVAHFSRTHVANILEKVSDGSAGKPVAGNVDYRLPGIPHSTVRKEDTNRKEIVTRLIQQFENHPNRDSLIQDLNKTEEFNLFNEKSKGGDHQHGQHGIHRALWDFF